MCGEKTLSEKLKKKFQDCQKFLSTMVAKINERSPLQYKITWVITAIVPAAIISNKVLVEKKFKKLVEILHERNWIPSVTADSAKLQFACLTSAAAGKFKAKFDSFNENED